MQMLRIDLLVVGKLKEEYWRRACEEYVKRLGAFAKVQIVELPEAKVPQNPNAAQIAAALKTEGQSILAKVPGQSVVVAMCIEGQMLSSEQLAEQMEQRSARGEGQFAFVIGGSWGLDAAVKSRADVRLSMSRMTFPHQLARVMLLEQIYRACSIQNHTKYHK